MEKVKALAKRHLGANQIRVLRRWAHAWRDRREQSGATEPLGYTVTDLRHASRQLWAGHSETAGKVLRQVVDTPQAPGAHKARAAFQLAKLQASNGDWATAQAWLPNERVSALDPTDRARALVLKAVAAMETGNISVAEACLDDAVIDQIGKNQQWLLRSNLEYYRAWSAGTAPDHGADQLRLDHINAIFRSAGLIEIQKADPEHPLELDNITASESGGALHNFEVCVSILVPCFNAEATISFALDSILAQTHSNVEILCVDDCSTDRTREIVQSYVDRGAPVTLLVNERNSGPYYSRNRALRHATGDFVTVQDADDWMHPQRLEMQLIPLLMKKRARFSFTRLARVASGFVFTLRPYRPMLEPIHWSYTSIMGAREDYLNLGGWDPVVAHADAEFIDRIKDVLGEDALQECYEDVPMALFSDGPGNLTKRTGTGLTSVGFGARREYQEQAKLWRKERGVDFPAPELIERPSARQPFFAPNALLPPRLRRDNQYDFVFITDMSLLGGTRRCNLEYFQICVDRGWKVGVFNYPRYRGRHAGSIDAAYRRLFDRGEVDLLTPEDEVDAAVVIAHHPPILNARIDGYPTIHTSNVALLVNQLPYQSRHQDAELLYDTEQVAADLESEFGCVPVWIPISGLVREELERFVGVDRVWEEAWYPVVGWANTAATDHDQSPPSTGRAIRVGRHSRDDATKWPDSSDELRLIYPKQMDIEIHILGGAETVCGGRARIPSNWKVQPFDAVEVKEFLAGIDVFIHWTRSDYIEEFGRNVAEAMACGVPCILSSDLEPTFGDAALYPPPEEVEKSIRALAADTELRRALVARGYAFVRGHCSAEVAGDRMAELLARDALTDAAS